MLLTVLGGLLVSGGLAVRAAGPLPVITLLDPEVALAQVPLEREASAASAAWPPLPSVAFPGDHEPPHGPPHRPPGHPPAYPRSDKTVYQSLGDDPKFSKIFKLVNLNEATVDLLNTTSSASITFFALPDSAFPKHGEKKGGCHHLEDPAKALPGSGEELLLTLSESLDELDGDDDGDDDDERKKRWRKIIRKIIGAVITYHVLPQEVDWPGLLVNSTYATNLTLHDGSLDGEPLRIHVGQKLVPPAIVINYLSYVRGPQNLTSNGVIHAVNFPLFPPPSIFPGLFAFPEGFSTLTSALQRTGLTADVNWEWKHSDRKMSGTKAVTFFAPSNRAFERLPFRLRRFLFSPFGTHALRKLLQFHVVPDLVLHSDYIHNVTDSARAGIDVSEHVHVPQRSLFEDADEFDWDNEADMSEDDFTPFDRPYPPHRRPHRPEVQYNTSFTLPTLLTNYTLDVVITKYKVQPPGFPKLYPTSVAAEGVYATLPDVVSRNGAVHVVGWLLNPLKKHKHPHHPPGAPSDDGFDEWEYEEERWADWEEWLPKWAAQD
jgi:uncharacterized surface protein with fasciclin (FAS1) repeats